MTATMDTYKIFASLEAAGFEEKKARALTETISSVQGDSVDRYYVDQKFHVEREYLDLRLQELENRILIKVGMMMISILTLFELLKDFL